MLTDQAKAVGRRWDYEPFGSVRAQNGTANSDFQFAGEQKDSETGLINLRACYYDPTLGRFLSRDVMSGRPGFPQTFNRYAYALNNPLRLVDPSGYCGEDDNWSGCDNDFSSEANSGSFSSSIYDEPGWYDEPIATEAAPRPWWEQQAWQQQDNWTLGSGQRDWLLDPLQFCAPLSFNRCRQTPSDYVFMIIILLCVRMNLPSVIVHMGD